MKKVLLVLTVLAFNLSNAQVVTGVVETAKHINKTLATNAEWFKKERTKVTEGPKIMQGEFVTVDPTAVFGVNGDKMALYNKAINWINTYYKNPEEVIKGKIEGEYLRFDGFQKSLISVNSIGIMHYYNVRYTIKLNFKDNKVRFKVTNAEYYTRGSKYSVGGWNNLIFTFKSKNRKGREIKMFGEKTFMPAINHFELIAKDLNAYMLSEENTTDKNDDW